MKRKDTEIEQPPPSELDTAETSEPEAEISPEPTPEPPPDTEYRFRFLCAASSTGARFNALPGHEWHSGEEKALTAEEAALACKIAALAPTSDLAKTLCEQTT